MKHSNHGLKKKILHKMMDTKGILFHLAGIVCIIWFLFRVIPKPDRIRYPCQQMSLSIAIGYITFWSVLWGSLFFGFGLWIRRVKHKTAAFIPLIVIVFVIVFSVSSNVYAVHFIKENDNFASWDSIPNQPIGTPTGLNPGRVVWIWNKDATENEISGFWWQEENNNQEVIDEMVSKGICNLAGNEDEKEAWDNLFEYFNEKKNKGSTSYQPGEQIAIKVNLNNCWQAFSYVKADNERDASPYVVKALLHQLTDVVGVAQKDITVYDASRPMANWFYNRVYYESYPSLNLVPEFPDVNFVDSKGGAKGREKVVASNKRIYFAEGPCEYRTLPKRVSDTDYIINIPILKRHPIQNGVTLSGKNFFGSWMEEVAPIHPYHESGLVMGNAAPQVDLLAHEEIGGKTLLFLGDGTYATKIDHSTIGKFQMEPFNGDWTNSLFFSQDPIAMDSVMYDFLHAEGTNPIEGSQNYMHQAADPILNKYDPENDGIYLDYSLGVHEHWNKSKDIFSSERYSLIDFVAINDNDEEKSVEIIKPDKNYLYLNNKALFKIRNTFVLGDIKVETRINSGNADIEKVEFYINDELMDKVEVQPYEWVWEKPTNDKYNLKVIAFFDDQEELADSMYLWKFG